MLKSQCNPSSIFNKNETQIKLKSHQESIEQQNSWGDIQGTCSVVQNQPRGETSQPRRDNEIRGFRASKTCTALARRWPSSGVPRASQPRRGTRPRAWAGRPGTCSCDRSSGSSASCSLPSGSPSSQLQFCFLSFFLSFSFVYARVYPNFVFVMLFLSLLYILLFHLHASFICVLLFMSLL